MSLKLARKNKEVDPQSWETFYKNKIIYKIRANENKDLRLTSDDEVAILRKEVARLTKMIQELVLNYLPSDEFSSYHNQIEQIKEETKKEIEE